MTSRKKFHLKSGLNQRDEATQKVSHTQVSALRITKTSTGGVGRCPPQGERPDARRRLRPRRVLLCGTLPLASPHRRFFCVILTSEFFSIGDTVFSHQQDAADSTQAQMKTDARDDGGGGCMAVSRTTSPRRRPECTYPWAVPQVGAAGRAFLLSTQGNTEAG